MMHSIYRGRPPHGPCMGARLLHLIVALLAVLTLSQGPAAMAADKARGMQASQKKSNVKAEQKVQVKKPARAAGAPVKAHAGTAKMAPPAPKLVTTESGLKYEDIAVGAGPSPKLGDRVVIHYTSAVKDGKKVDSSRDRGKPYEFVVGVGQVIQGWDEGIMSMKAGGRRKLTIPPGLAYGAGGSGGVIPPNATLVCDVELIAVREAPRAVVNMETTKGTIKIELFRKEAPISSANFERLVRAGFYNGLTFHRVETSPEFRLIQGGDPAGNGSGGPGYNIKGEFAANGWTTPKTHVAGAVAMARSQSYDSAGSQFYICINPVHQLDGNYAVFGQVVEGLDVAEKIVVGDKMTKVTMAE
jgi:FKBP-type peptidyl-prolyl cis-trans isomerase/cyclophilin family peptidyl-prolyl cis-trans isomerase